MWANIDGRVRQSWRYKKQQRLFLSISLKMREFWFLLFSLLSHGIFWPHRRESPSALIDRYILFYTVRKKRNYANVAMFGGI